MNDKDEAIGFNLPMELVGPIIKESVSAAIVRTLGDPTDLINQLVSKALGEKVDSKGEVNRYSSENKYLYIEALAGNAIREYAKEALAEVLLQQRGAIMSAVKAELAKKSQVSAIAKVLVDSMTNAVENKYRMGVNVSFDKITD